MLKKPLAFIFISLLLTAPLQSKSDARNDGLTAFKQGQYEQALSHWIPLAQSGDREIQYNLGVMYSEGRGVKKDTQQALLWLTQAAEQNDSDAQFRLARLYIKAPDITDSGITDSGIEGPDTKKTGIEQNFTLAEHWLRLAANKKHATASYYLAQLYANGKGLPQDNELALRWYYKAAQYGNTDAMYNLAYIHEHGEGASKNLAEAFRWYDKAARKGASDAQANLGRLYFTGQGTKQDRVLAYTWFKLASDKNIAQARKNAQFSFKQLNKADQLQARALYEEYKKKFFK
ncbi:hypothetical protein MNBD_GAMMA10-2200 [hydrothermal vent metagenome]|uniref:TETRATRICOPEPTIDE REPEAT FAMILY PROTEIN n=1 Tax=hydrothermal vent metagenome TaxID=652676 RepID=A0A3B0XB30_9ZZZZ